MFRPGLTKVHGKSMKMAVQLICLAIAGALGTLARYGLGGLVQRGAGTDYPWGTTAVNVLGCLFFGILWAVGESRLSFTGPLRMVIFVGFFGGFTTFSSYAFETARMLEESQWLWAGGNFVLQNAVGIFAMLAGLKIGSMI